MRNTLLSAILAVAATALVAEAARPCNNPTKETFQYLLGDARYEVLDGSSYLRGDLNLSQITVSLQSPTRTPLYDCVTSWNEEWGGWYNGGGSLLWANCNYTGAGPVQDEMVSFAVDWPKQKLYLAHVFACSDSPGAEGLATGSQSLNLNCSSAADGSSVCVPRTTSNGSPSTDFIITTISQAPLNATWSCDEPKPYQSWKLQNWWLYDDLHPRVPRPHVVQGLYFELVQLPGGDRLDCTTFNPTQHPLENPIITGVCQSPTHAVRAATFSFDYDFSWLEISQPSKCTDALRNASTGAIQITDTCQKVGLYEYNCTLGAAWIGTGRPVLQ